MKLLRTYWALPCGERVLIALVAGWIVYTCTLRVNPSHYVTKPHDEMGNYAIPSPQEPQP